MKLTATFIRSVDPASRLSCARSSARWGPSLARPDARSRPSDAVEVSAALDRGTGDREVFILEQPADLGPVEHVGHEPRRRKRLGTNIVWLG
jgi:hypothetical protein